jgi:hypothetical protein
MYRPKPWATISGAFNDLERHNNTNNNQSAVAAGDDPYEGPIDHVDHSRVASLGAVLSPNEHYGLDFNYAYSDVYAATNICYDNGATPTLPGTASTNSSGGPRVCPACTPGDRRPSSRTGLPGTSWMLPRSTDRWLSRCLPSTNPLQYRLSHQLCERQSVLQRCARGQRLARLHVSVSLCESCMDDPSRIDLESGIQLLRLRRGRPFRLAVLQHVNESDINGCSLHLSARTDGSDRIACRSERAAELSCE